MRALALAYPEAVVLAMNVALLALAYQVIYPRVVRGDLGRLARADAATTALALALAGLAFWGRHVPFDLFGWRTNWFLFALLTFSALEVPLFVRFVRRFGIDGSDRSG